MTLRKFIDKRGEGVYRIAFGSDDIDGVLSHFNENAVQYVDMSSQAALGSRVVFTHPKSTHGLMIEVVEGR
ncbi:hypothetical protein AYO38_11000 [bacterium SCGC AG-212-C10]|nr:hypothetical protein AYO38_11000 [bacterium SCGC AG-212-C10]